jgi:hypothetical protein
MKVVDAGLPQRRREDTVAVGVNEGPNPGLE